MCQARWSENKFRIYLIVCLGLFLAVANVSAAEYRGQVVFNDLGVPGAVVTASQGDQKLVAITDAQGGFSFSDLPDGVWNIRIDMQTFSSLQREVTIGSATASEKWELRLLPIDQIQGLQTPTPTPAPQPAQASAATDAKPAKNAGKKGAPLAPTTTQTPFQRTDVNATGAIPEAQAGTDTMSAAPPSGDQNPADLSQRAADGFVISGTANNSASSPFAINLAFGNTRNRGIRSLYTGNVALIIDNSALDARSYSLTGMNTEKPAYNHMRGTFSFQGPLRIPHLVRNGPTFYVGGQFTRNRDVRTESGLVPTLAERNGDLSQAPGQIYNPATNLAFENNRIPPDQISRQAASLLRLYPLPNFTGSTRYNYQIPVVGATHLDSVYAALSKGNVLKNQYSGSFSIYSSRSDNPNLMGFRDTSRTLGVNTNAGWRHGFTRHLFSNFGYQFNYQSTKTVPFFANRENISGLAGITGNDQEAVNWGPPALVFMSGLYSLSDAIPASTRNQTSALSLGNVWSHKEHTVSFGGQYRRQQMNLLSQEDPRGAFTFTGTSTLGPSGGILLPGARNDFAGFLLGIPDTVRIAFGNADKYFRWSSYEAYVADDWRVNSSITLNIGIRWEYSSPMTELYGRLVSLDISRGFSAVSPVVATHPVGPITGAIYADSLVAPDRSAFQPRIGIAWRPAAASSMVVRGGYGIYYNSSPYQSIALQMAQQSPLSKSLRLQNTAENPLTLADGFNASPNTTANTFAVDPKLRIGYLHIWQISIQRDLPFAMQITAAYQGTRGRHALHQFLPNTYPLGAVNPCPSCPSGFVYMTSNGTSSREAGTIQLRRRLRSGFSATMDYTYSKSIDDAAPGGNQTGAVFIAQDWLNPRAERALSSFDRRHQLNINFQFTSGMGIRGGTLMKGWKAALLKEWTLSGQLNAVSGYPLTPVYPAAVLGTGVTGPVRPDYTGADIKAAPAGLHLNPAAYTAPAGGHWGNAGRNSIPGPSQFGLNASLARTFRTSDRTSLDLRVDANNMLNHVTFPSWNTTVGSAQFGLPLIANPMRNVQTTIRWTF
jgi:hypothetical protein